MKIVFSRKGFDTSRPGGGGASPIVDGRPVSLPIPYYEEQSRTTFADLDLADHVYSASKGRITGSEICHNDPMFENGKCALGQISSAQGHLRKQGVGAGVSTAAGLCTGAAA